MTSLISIVIVYRFSALCLRTPSVTPSFTHSSGIYGRVSIVCNLSAMQMGVGHGVVWQGEKYE